MADGKVLLEVVVEGKNVKVVQRQVEGVTEAVNENTTAQRRNSKATNEAASGHENYDRKLKGVHQTNLSGAKSFSKIRDAVGSSSGLVGAYATLAANLFAATAAFSALQKAAQVEQLTQGLSALGSASGIAMGSLAKGLQEATGHAISLQDAMRQVAMVTSAGFDPSIIERLGTVAKNTSVALGRDLQDSMNRLVKGAVKLEPELLDELGIMVRIDEATQQYAKDMGKSATQLTNFEKRQAFMNAVLAEGEKKFGAIGNSVDANPYDKLSATIQELSTKILNFANILLGPLAGALASSKLALLGVVLVISKGVINQALPYFNMLAQAASKAAQQYSASWTAASKEAMAAVVASRATIVASDTKGLNKKQSLAFTALGAGAATKDEGAALQKSVEDRIAKLQVRQSHGWKKEGNALESLSKQNIARYEKELALLQAKLGLIKNINAAEAANTAAQAGSAVAKEASTFAKTIEESSNAFDDAGGVEALGAFATGLKNVTLGGVGYIKGMTAATGANTRFTGGLRIARMTMTAFGATATVVGRVVSFAFKGLLAAVPYIGMIMLAVDLLIAGFDKLKESFKTDATKELEKKLEDSSSVFKELGTSSEEVAKSLIGASSSMITFAQRTEAQANITSQLSKEFLALADAQRKAGGTGDEFLKAIDEQIQKNPLLSRAFEEEFGGLKNLQELRKKNNGSLEETIAQTDKFLTKQKQLSAAQNVLNKVIKDSNNAFSDYSNSFIKTDTVTKYALALEQAVMATQGFEGNNLGLARSFSELSDEQLKFLGTNRQEADSLAKKADQVDMYETAQRNLIKTSQDLTEALNIKSLDKNVLRNAEAISKAEVELRQTLKAMGTSELLPEFTFLDTDADKVQKLRKAMSFYTKETKDGQNWFQRLIGANSSAISKLTDNLTGVLTPQYELIKNQVTLAGEFELANLKIKGMEDSYKRFGITSLAQVSSLTTAREAAAAKEIQILDTQIKQNQQMLDSKVDAEGNKLGEIGTLQRQNAIDLLKEQKRIQEEINAEQFSAAGKQRTTLQFQIQGLEAITSELNNQIQIQQKLAAYAKETSEARMKIRESEAKLENLKAGGTGELSAQKQYDLQLQANRDRKVIIEQEKNAKIQSLALERDLIQRKFELSLVELSLLKSREGYNQLDPRLKDLVDKQLAAYTVYTKGVDGEMATVSFRSANIGEQVYVAGVEAANTVARAEVVADELSAAEKKRTADLESINSQATLLNERLTAENSINDIYNRINSARTSIIDNERRVAENNLKAINLRNTGKYELTAQQTLELEMAYADKREVLIKEEETRKLKIIDLEYDLLKAQTEAQQLTLRGTMQTLAQTQRDNAASAPDAGTAAKYEEEAKRIEGIAQRLDASFTNVISTAIPEAQAAARQAIISETEAAVSDLGANVLSALQSSLDSFNPVITATVETNIPQIGQMFDASGLVSTVSDAIGATINNTVLTAQDTLDKLNKKGSLSQPEQERKSILDQIVAQETRIAELKKQKETAVGPARNDIQKQIDDARKAQTDLAGSDPFTTMRAGAVALQTVMAPMIESLKTLGPQGELVAAIAQGSTVMAQSFTTLGDTTKSAADKFAAVGAIVASVSAIVNSAGAARVANIDREINAERKRDGKSKESLERIASLEKKKEAVAKKNFNLNKKMMMAQVVMSAAATIAGIMGKESARLGIYAVPLAFAVGGLALAQLAVIAGTSYEGGGSGGGAGSAPASISVGERRSTVDLAKSQSASGELSYLQGDKGTGGPENFRPAFIGSRAAGGRVNAGYMVGEQGPELFVPKIPGRIVPADKVNNAPAQNVNISISALDASGVEDVLIKQRGHIIGMIREAANSYGEKFLESVDTRVYTQPSKGNGVARA